MIKVIIVDDHELIREGLKKVLGRNSDITIAGEASNSVELFEILSRQHSDVVVLDISLPGRSGIDILKDLKEIYPQVKTLVLSMHPEEKFAVRVLKSGASGYLSKESAATELVDAVRKIYTGGKYISETLAEKLAFIFEVDTDKPLHENLSDREFEVMRLISSGKSVSDIAEQLCISVNTVTSYRARIMEKMKMKSNAEIIRYAIQNQLVE